MPLLFDDGSNAEERNESGEEKENAHDEIGAMRRENETAQVGEVLVADEADSGNRVAVYRRHGQDGDCLDSRDEPRRRGGKTKISTAKPYDNCATQYHFFQ